jgi:hypothetical protein
MRHVAVLLFMLASTALLADDNGAPPTRNAIFNGDFLEGTAGWSIGGPDDVHIKTHRSMIADRADAELSLRHDGLAESMGLFSQYPINVETERDYTLTLTAAGEGDIAFGVYEYNEQGRNTIFPLSQRIALTAEPRTYTFTYTASARAVTIRPRIVIFGKAPIRAEPVPQQQPADGSASAFHVRLMRFELLLPQAKFAKTTQWPQWAVSGEHKNYRGLSGDEIQRIEQTLVVDRVLPPYEPIREVSAGVYQLTTSRFEFHESVFPDSMSVLGEPILAGKMRFEMRTAGGQSVAFADSMPTFTGDEQQVAASQTVAGDGWTLNLTGTLAYDALLIVDLTLHADRPTQITNAALSIPFTEQVARCIRYSKDFPDDTFCFGEGPIPAAGETVDVRLTVGRSKIKNDWAPQRLDEAHGTLWQWTRGVPRYFWIGDEEKGLAFLTDSDQGWRFDDNDVTLSLERTDEGLVARLNFVTQTTTVTDSWKLRLIIQAMPPKPVRADWFKMRFNRFWNWLPGDQKMIERIEARQAERPSALVEEPPAYIRYAQAGGGTGAMRPPWESLPHRDRDRVRNDIGLLWWDVWSVGCSSPQVAKPELMKRYLDSGSRVGLMALPYFAPTHMSMNDLNGYYYAAKTDQWAKLPQSGNTSAYVKICPNSFASDYMADGIGKLIDEYGIEGVYFDNTEPEPCANRGHGCGWTDEGGVTHPTMPFLALRRLFMMIRNEFVKRGKTPFIMKHAGMFPGTISFTDANLDAEGIYGYDHTQMFTTDEFRARYIGPNQFGVVEVYLPQFSYGTDTTDVSRTQQIITGTRRLMAMALVHGTPIYCGAIQSGPMFAAWGILDQLRGPTVDFIGYWKWPYAQTLTQRNIYIAIYRQPEQSVLVVSNLGPDNAQVVIPRAELDDLIPGLQSARDDMDHWGVELNDGSLRLSVPAKNFRLISLE